MIEKLSTNYVYFIIVFFVSALIALVVYLSLRSQMKLKKVDKINLTYVDKNKIKIYKSKDIFLYEETDGRN